MPALAAAGHPRSDSAVHLPISPKDKRHLIEENESLKAKIKFLQAQLKTHGHCPPQRLPRPYRSSSLSDKRSISAETRAGSGFYSLPKNLTHGKLNRHPSDTTDLSQSPQNDEDIDERKSGQSLKHRRHRSQRSDDSRELYDAETALLWNDAGLPRRLHLDYSTESIESRIHGRSSVNTETKTSYQQTRKTFSAAVSDRAGWLVGLLILQSMSSFIISRNEKLLQQHLVIVRFLTMLVGAGGNAGNQASVGKVLVCVSSVQHVCQHNQK